MFEQEAELLGIACVTLLDGEGNRGGTQSTDWSVRPV